MVTTGTSTSAKSKKKSSSKKGAGNKSTGTASATAAKSSSNSAGGGGGPAAAGSSAGGGGGGGSGGGGSGADGKNRRSNKQRLNNNNGGGLLSAASNSRLAAASAVAAANTSRSLLVIVLDVSPLAWGERDYMRTAQDKARAAKNKSPPSVGPVTLEEVINSIQAFCTAFLTLERQSSALLIIGVADNETAIVYPRKNALHQGLEMASEASMSSTTSAFETNRLQQDFTMGVAELVARASKKAEQSLQTMLALETTATTAAAAATEHQPQSEAMTSTNQAAMAAGFSKALCVINRFLVASNAPGAISALHRDGIIPNNNVQSSDSQGVLSLVNDSCSTDKKKKQSSAATNAAAAAAGSWSPRILLVQASEDRCRDYNAMMNCAFCSVKHHVTVDACFLATGSKTHVSSSPFLEQVCDLTCGVFLAPRGAFQIGGCLTEVFLSVFLPPLSCRPLLHLPALNKVDFRSRCFETAEVVNMAYVCNQCLSIFANKPGANSGGRCPTCHARILGSPAVAASATSSNTTTNSNKRFKES